MSVAAVEQANAFRQSEHQIDESAERKAWRAYVAALHRLTASGAEADAETARIAFAGWCRSFLGRDPLPDERRGLDLSLAAIMNAQRPAPDARDTWPYRRLRSIADIIRAEDGR